MRVIADHDLPQISGLDLLKRLKATGNETPFILFTGKGKEEITSKRSTSVRIVT